MATQLESVPKQQSLIAGSAPGAVARPTFEYVRLDLLDEPDLAMRQSFDPIKLEELAQSMREIGIIQSLLIERRGDRFEVKAGHRRTLAAKMAGLAVVPAMIVPQGWEYGEAAKNAENGAREDVNPADEAVYFWSLFEGQCQHDIDRVCALVKRKRDFVEGRIELLQGDVTVLEELQAGRITIGVARELNKIHDNISRLQGLDFAVKGGATVSVIRNFRVEQEMLLARQSAPELIEGATSASEAANVARVNVFTCQCCGGEEDPHLMVQFFVHSHCKLAILDKLLKTFRGE